MKKAILVTATFTTRIIVDADTMTGEELKTEVLEAVAPRFEQKLFHELNENITKVVEDTECPYNPEIDE